jgi:hypothetical protein
VVLARASSYWKQVFQLEVPNFKLKHWHLTGIMMPVTDGESLAS